MKKQTIAVASVFAVLFTIFLNQLLLLEYSLNLVEYIAYQMPLSKEDALILAEGDSLIFGGNISEPPLGLIEAETGQPVGLVIDYINALSLQMGVSILFKPMVWSDSLEALAKGETDLCDLIPSEARKEHFNFSKPIYTLKGIAVTRSGDAGLTRLRELSGKVIGAQKGDIAIESLLKIAPDIKLIETENVDQALKLLDKHEVDAVIGDEPVIWYYIKELSQVKDYHIIPEPVYDEDCVIAVTKGNDKLLESVNRAIFQLRRNGTLERINQKWSGYSPLLSKNMDGAKLKVLLLMLTSLLGALISLAIFANIKLKALVHHKTSELQFAFDNLSTFMIVLDLEGHIVNINQAMLKFLGYEKAWLLGKPATQVPLLKAALARLADEDELCFEGRYYEVRRDKNQMIFLRDITLEKIKAQQLIHSNRIEAIGQLASGVAHELRNPLGVIRNSTFLIKDIHQGTDPILTKAITSIDHAVIRASQTIDKLLNFARSDHMSATQVHIESLISEICEYFRVANKIKHIDFEIIGAKELLFCTDEYSLRHILINLIGNACDAITSQGQVCITYDLDPSEAGSVLNLSIWDNGSGIPKEAISRIFDPFYTTKAPGEGTGLGLFIVFSELQKIRGHIEVESEEGQWSRFIIRLGALTEGDYNGQ